MNEVELTLYKNSHKPDQGNWGFAMKLRKLPYATWFSILPSKKR